MWGWYLNTGASEGSEGADPAVFNVWATNEDPVLNDSGECALAQGADVLEGDRAPKQGWTVFGGDSMVTRWCGVNWSKVGAQKWKLTYVHTQDWVFLKLPVELSQRRGATETFALQVDKQVYSCIYVANYFFQGVFHLLALLSGILKRPILGMEPPTAFSAGFCMAGLSTMVGGAIASTQGEWLVVIEAVMVGFFTILFGLCCLSRHMVVLIFIRSVAYSIALWIWSYYLHGNALVEANQALIWAVIMLIWIGLRFRALVAAKSMLRQDQLKYDALWESIISTEDGRACVEHLQKVVRMIGLDNSAYCRQHNRLRVDKMSPKLRAEYLQKHGARPVHPLFRELNRFFVPVRRDPHSTIKCMDQLYTCAVITNMLLLDRVKMWAERANAFFRAVEPNDDPTRPGSGQSFVRWRDALENPADRARVRFAGLKRHTRAFEKLVRSYHNDTSRLLDVCRHCLVFENMTDLTNCLGIIITDDCVRVERLKNRLSPSWNSDDASGYRDVCINLSVISPVAQTLGTELHICEIQLLLLDFAKLRTSDGHKRYVAARNRGGK
jgi:hypothetical protein